ncbi:type VI secretion system contractile sheath large subunit [Zavarzinella formosa]|uniref:type VI secretion system contractile sheath large subunit n=1 Tax=Zavarzinella formosa TaxID=360055 RepID=UPI00031BE62A|nr:type VI secretion system contractile sheath large subunit [Zavarzinella formosa]
MSTEKASAAAGSTTTTEFNATGWLDQATAKMRVDDDPVAKKRGLDAIQQFINNAMQPGQVLQKDVEANIKTWIAAIDQKLTAQVNEILHHPTYQKLEGTWRGLHHLVHKSNTSTMLKIRVLNTTKDEIRNDLTKAQGFDLSELYKKVHDSEYGTLGGHPYGMLVGDYDFDLRRGPEVKLLQDLSGVAAVSHAPFVSAVNPKGFNIDSFAELPNPSRIAKIFESEEYAPWKSFRASEDSRYVALTLPRVLARLPYGERFQPIAEFNFEENVDGSDHHKFQWMNAAWAYATNVTNSFEKNGWMAQTRGVGGGGKVEGLPVATFRTDEGDLAMKCPTEVSINDSREAELSDLGFLPLIHCKGTDYAAFLGAQSCQKPVKYDDPRATSNAALSAKFNLMLCMSRFAHFLKVMVRERVGRYMERGDVEAWLNRWINRYVLESPESAGESAKAERPLAWAKIEVVDVPGQPGYYQAKAHLRPHFQLEGVDVSLRMVAQQRGA